MQWCSDHAAGVLTRSWDLCSQQSPTIYLIGLFPDEHSSAKFMPFSLGAPAVVLPTELFAPLPSAFVRQRRHDAEDELSFSQLGVRGHGHGCSGWTTRSGPCPPAQVPSPSD